MKWYHLLASLVVLGVGACGSDDGNSPGANNPDGGTTGGSGGQASGGSHSGGAAGTGTGGANTGGTHAGGSANTGGSAGVAGGAGAAGTAGSGGGSCTDTCPASPGVTWGCKSRFMYGINWAWRSFGGDFGGINAWGQAGVAASSSAVSSDMQQMKAAGVSVVRWWMFPRFWTESISFDSDDAPSGIGGTMVADIQQALALAEQNDVYIMLTPFSFDGFAPTQDESGIYTRGMTPLVTDAARRSKLITNLVVPIAQAVESSPYKHRMIAWDMINEPEWAMTGPNSYGGEDFQNNGELSPVTHAQMETFLNEMADALHANSTALVSIGSAAIKWGTAWTHSHVDFYMLHYYDWVYEWFPYTTTTLASVGLTDKPVVMGEFPTQGLSAIPSQGLPARTPAELAADLWANGYAGALSWAYNDSAFPFNPATIKAFPDQHPCETQY